MRDKQSRKVVIINDIDSANIEKAILILRNGGASTPAPAGYHIVNEAQEIINAYRRTMEKTQAGVERREQQLRRSGHRASVVRRTLCALGAFLAFLGISGIILNMIQPLLEKF